MDKLEEIKTKLNKYCLDNNTSYVLNYDILDESSINIIYDLFVNNIVNSEHNALTSYYYGIYYDIRGNDDLIIKYYLLSIDKGNIDAINNLGLYYHWRNYNLAIKYYLMAIDKGFSYAANGLAILYYDFEKNNEMAIKYWLIGIDKDDTLSMYNLADYYYYDEENYPLGIKYWIMAANLKHSSSIEKINEILHKKFNTEIAVQVYDHLDEKNLSKLNRKICKAFKLKKLIKNSNQSWNITSSFCCVNCKQNGVKCVFQSCGHSTCIDCFTDDFKCSLCH